MIPDAAHDLVRRLATAIGHEPAARRLGPLPTRYAEGHTLGDTVAMRLGDGSRVQLRLVATVDAERGYETALVPASLLVGRTNAGLVPTIPVSAAPDTDLGRLSAGLTKLTLRHPC